MDIPITTLQQKGKYFSIIRQTIQTAPLCCIKYLDFKVKVIRVLCYTPEIIPFLQQELTFVLKDQADHFDETIVVGKIGDVRLMLYQMEDRLNPKINLHLRVEMLLAGKKYPDIAFMDPDFSATLPVIKCAVDAGVVEGYDIQNHTCYYAVCHFEPEEFIKLGHVFVQQLNVLLKTPNVNLTHGAVFGYKEKGVLLCARGQRGKSTLTVHSLLNGCDYVSDDYQLLEKRAGELYAYPLYSIITLSPQMYQQMYDNFDGKFCFNNGRKDKYVFNIACYHDRFKTNYPIKLCLFPEIVPDEQPCIEPCSPIDKARAIVQFIHSTVFQVRDLNDTDTIRKLFEMVCPLPFYKLKLCPDISKNTAFLKHFLSQKQPLCPPQPTEETMLDITFDLAHILNTKTFTLYSFNQFASNLYQMILCGIPSTEIVKELNALTKFNPDLLNEFKHLTDVLKQNKWDKIPLCQNDLKRQLDVCLAKECGYKLSLLCFDKEKTRDLLETKGK